MPTSKDKLNLCFSKMFQRFRPQNWKQEIAKQAAPGEFRAWINSISDAEAEEIRVEMVTTLL